MQLNITINESDSPAVIKRAIAALEGFAGLQSIDIKMDKGAIERLTELSGAHPLSDEAVAASRITFNAIVNGDQPPLVPPAANAPSTVAAVPSPTAPVVPQASSPEPSVPPAPAVPTVPAATAPTEPAAPTTHASGVVIDKAGLPWDARIHSGNKKLNADGTWAKRRGLNDAALVKRIESELLAAMAVPAGPVIETSVLELPRAVSHDLPLGLADTRLNLTTAEYAMPSIPAPTEVPVAAVPFTAPPPPAAPTAPATVPQETPTASIAVPTVAPTTLAELMPRITGAMMTGALPGTALLDVVKAPPFGIPDLPTLAHRPDLIPQVWSVLQATYPGVLV